MIEVIAVGAIVALGVGMCLLQRWADRREQAEIDAILADPKWQDWDAVLREYGPRVD